VPAPTFADAAALGGTARVLDAARALLVTRDLLAPRPPRPARPCRARPRRAAHSPRRARAGPCAPSPGSLRAPSLALLPRRTPSSPRARSRRVLGSRRARSRPCHAITLVARSHLGARALLTARTPLAARELSLWVAFFTAAASAPLARALPADLHPALAPRADPVGDAARKAESGVARVPCVRRVTHEDKAAPVGAVGWGSGRRAVAGGRCARYRRRSAGLVGSGCAAVYELVCNELVPWPGEFMQTHAACRRPCKQRPGKSKVPP
jgi:hypothetical protein